MAIKSVAASQSHLKKSKHDRKLPLQVDDNDEAFRFWLRGVDTEQLEDILIESRKIGLSPIVYAREHLGITIGAPPIVGSLRKTTEDDDVLNRTRLLRADVAVQYVSGFRLIESWDKLVPALHSLQCSVETQHEGYGVSLRHFQRIGGQSGENRIHLLMVFQLRRAVGINSSWAYYLRRTLIRSWHDVAGVLTVFQHELGDSVHLVHLIRSASKRGHLEIIVLFRKRVSRSTALLTSARAKRSQ